MEKKGSGLRKKFISKAKKKYRSKYITIVKLIYSFKEYKEFKDLKKLDSNYKKKIKQYWQKYHIKVGLKEFEFYKSKNAKDDPRYISKKIYHSEIEPKFNDVFNSEFLSNKNYLDLILKDANLPQTIVRNVDGVLLNKNYELITIDEAINLIKNEQVELIYKPAIDTGGGRGIIFLDFKNKTIIDILKNEKDFVIQKVIEQHEYLSNFNKTSLNTVRVLSFLFEGEVHVLYMVLRVGKDGMRVDNASSGGIQVVIKDDGTFSDYIVNINNKSIEDNDIRNKFINKKMPFYDKIISEVKRLHPLVSVCKLIGWDVAIDKNGNPVIIEMNLKDIGMTDKSQCINGPLFGDLTDSVLKFISKK